MPFPDLPPERIPGSPGHLNDHQLIDQALDYIQQAGYRDDPDFPPLPDVPVLGQSGHVTAHDRILAVLQYIRDNNVGMVWAQVSNTPTGTYKGSDGHTYAYYTFTSNGTLTVTASGLMDVLTVGGGGGGSLTAAGGGGGVMYGLVSAPADSLPVTVGAGGNAQRNGSPSMVGDLSKAAGGGPAAADSSVYAVTFQSGSGGGGGGGFALGPGKSMNGGGAGGTLYGSDVTWGRVLTITGSSYEYGPGGPRLPGNYGAGGPGNQPGSKGVVIVKTRLN